MILPIKWLGVLLYVRNVYVVLWAVFFKEEFRFFESTIKPMELIIGNTSKPE